MATKPKGSKRGASSEARAASEKPAEPPMDALYIDEDLSEHVWEVQRNIGLPQLRKQQNQVRDLRQRLAEAEAALEYTIRPLRAIERAIQAATDDGDEPDDIELCKAIAGLELVESFATSAMPPRPTGAVPWQELIVRGATDDQILINLRNCRDDYSGPLLLYHAGENVQLKKKGAVITSGPAVIARVRRVLGIPLPPKAAAPMKAPASKPAPKASPKRKSSGKSKKTSTAKGPKPAAKKSSPKAPAAKKSKPATSTKAKPKSGAQKRREAKERAEKSAANAPADKEGEPKAPTAFGYALQVPKGNDFSTLAKVWRKRIEQLAADRSADLTNLPLPVKDAILAIRIKQLGAAVGAECAQPPGAKCVECKCDEDHACPGGCWWVRHPEDPDKPLCSKCLQKVIDRMVAMSGPPGELGDALGFNRAARNGVVDHNEVPPAIANKKPRAGVAQQAAAKRSQRKPAAAGV